MNIASSDSQIDKPQRGRPKIAEPPDVNINTGAQSINTESVFNLERVSFFVNSTYKSRSLDIHQIAQNRTAHILSWRPQSYMLVLGLTTSRVEMDHQSGAWDACLYYLRVTL